MPTRQTASCYQKSLFSVPPLPTGYSATPSDLFISPVGIEDVDKALFNLFNKEIGFQVSGDDVDGAKKLSVVFQAGEKWALMKKLRSMRDRNGSLKLPIMSVLRTSVVQDMSTDINGRGINQQTGELVVKRRLDKSDRAYQNSINRLGLQHQSNIASSEGVDVVSETLGTSSDDEIVGDDNSPVLVEESNSVPATSRSVSDLLLTDTDVASGALLKSNKTNNIFEIIVLPSPQFFTATYEVTFWAQYTTHMNQLLGQLMGSFLPQGNAWRIDTPAGYWFVAVVDNNSYSSKENADDFSAEERVIKYEFTVTIKGYSFAPRETGQPIPVRRYVSAPQVSFEISTSNLTQSLINSGVVSSITSHATGTGLISVSGTPNGNYRLRVKIVSNLIGSAAYVTSGNVAVQISLNGGVTFGQQILVPVSGIMSLTKISGAVPTNTGLVLTFTTSTTTFLFADYYVATCQAPLYGSGTTDIVDPFLGADDPTLPMSKNANKRPDHRFDGNTLLYKNPGMAEIDPSPQDPALSTVPRGVPIARYQKVSSINEKGQQVIRYVKVRSVNKFTGESVIAIGDASLGGVSILLDE